MFAQFRAQYPQGSIKTELLAQKVDGMHVFRVAIADGDLILSTATAADSDLEVAEDRAVKRALILAGFTLEPELREVREMSEPRLKATLMPAETRNEPSHELNNQSTNQLRQLPRFVPESNQALPQSSPSPIASINNPINHAIHNFEEQEYNQPTFEHIRSERSEPVQPIIVKESKILEFSDAIAQTTVELRRLGWTEEQGREYLMQTYKKNSRMKLSPEQINQFLAYLQSQTSEHPPF